MSDSNDRNFDAVDTSSRELILEAQRISDPFRRRLYVLGVLTRLLKPHDIQPILVGGGAVEFYTLGAYATRDLDLVAPGKDLVDRALRALGFTRHTGHRHWYQPYLDVAIEVPADVLAGSVDKVLQVEIADHHIHIIGVEDLILDRLRALVHWQSAADGEWASHLVALHSQEIDWPYLRNQAADEDLGPALQQCEHDVQDRKASEPE